MLAIHVYNIPGFGFDFCIMNTPLLLRAIELSGRTHTAVQSPQPRTTIFPTSFNLKPQPPGFRSSATLTISKYSTTASHYYTRRQWHPEMRSDAPFYTVRRLPRIPVSYTESTAIGIAIASQPEPVLTKPQSPVPPNAS